jgi:hypothetical protein
MSQKTKSFDQKRKEVPRWKMGGPVEEISPRI